jgi:hypothetical protein
MGILMFRGLTARRLYKPFGVKGLITLSVCVFSIDGHREEGGVKIGQGISLALAPLRVPSSARQ